MKSGCLIKCEQNNINFLHPHIDSLKKVRLFNFTHATQVLICTIVFYHCKTLCIHVYVILQHTISCFLMHEEHD